MVVCCLHAMIDRQLEGGYVHAVAVTVVFFL